MATKKKRGRHLKSIIDRKISLVPEESARKIRVSGAGGTDNLEIHFTQRF